MSNGIIIEAATATEKQRDGSVPLNEYPKLYRPVILTENGRVLVTVADLESVHEQRHRLLLQDAQSAFDDDEEEEDASANKNDGKEKQVSGMPLPRLRVAKNRAPVALPSAGKSEEEKDDDDNDDDNDDADKEKGDKKKKKKKKKKKESKESKHPKKRMWEDIDSDEDGDKGEGTSYKRLKNHTGKKADKKSG
jgi:hypothetical protein